MVKKFITFALATILMVGLAPNTITAQDGESATELVADGSADAELSGVQIIKQKFIEGGPGFMALVLVCLILGLALCIERVIYLNMASTNTTWPSMA